MAFRALLALFAVTVVQNCLCAQVNVERAIQRAVQLLSTEVPNWIKENQCASCHNQGDGARALLAAEKAGHVIDDRVLESTFQWLATPEDWEKNRGLAEASDQNLANLQFAATLATARQSRPTRFKTALQTASNLLIAQQSSDGAWRIEDGSIFASPLTQGPILLTAQAVKVLRQSDHEQSRTALARAARWLDRQQPQNTLESSSLILARAWIQPDSAQALLDGALKLAATQRADGGWGPHANAPAEIFDTSLAIIALAESGATAEAIKLAKLRGTEFLLRRQFDDGSWEATTRPPGTESYAHRISTTAWATQALLHYIP